MGIIRVDIHASTLGLRRAEDFRDLREVERLKSIELIDAITKGLIDDVRAIRKPRRAKNREFVTLYPIRALERYLKNRLLPYRQLRCLKLASILNLREK